MLISKNNVSLRVQLKNEMVGKCLGPKWNDHDSFNTNLPDVLNSFRAEESSKPHGETWRYSLLIGLVLGEMESDSVFDEQLMFLLWFRDLKDVGGGVEIIDVWHSK